MEKLWKPTFLLILSTTLTACASQSSSPPQSTPAESSATTEQYQKVSTDPQPAKSQARKTADGKLILGEKEWVYIPGLEQSYRARIDTGATTSSISAVDIVSFERDGKDWVKFKMQHDGVSSKEIALPVERWVKIKQSSADGTQRRAVVYAWIEIGGFKEKTEFTLADRTHLSFPVLLGRSFFKDVAVVDVSRKYVQDKHQ